MIYMDTELAKTGSGKVALIEKYLERWNSEGVPAFGSDPYVYTSVGKYEITTIGTVWTMTRLHDLSPEGLRRGMKQSWDPGLHYGCYANELAMGLWKQIEAEKAEAELKREADERAYQLKREAEQKEYQKVQEYYTQVDLDLKKFHGKKGTLRLQGVIGNENNPGAEITGTFYGDLFIDKRDRYKAYVVSHRGTGMYIMMGCTLPEAKRICYLAKNLDLSATDVKLIPAEDRKLLSEIVNAVKNFRIPEESK